MGRVVNCEELAMGREVPAHGGNSLQDLCAAVLGRHVEKVRKTPRVCVCRHVAQFVPPRLAQPQGLRLSDWECQPLSWDQLNYAATDAYASFKLYKGLCELPKRAISAPPAPLPAASLAAHATARDAKGATEVAASARIAKLGPAKVACWEMWHQQVGALLRYYIALSRPPLRLNLIFRLRD